MPPLTMTHEKAIQQAQSLVPLIEENHFQASQQRQQQIAVIEALKDSGLIRLLLPSSKGGYNLGVNTLVETLIEIAKGDASTGWCAACFLTHNALLCYFSSQAQQEVLEKDGLDSLIATSFVANAAKPTKGGYLLKGRWPWASGIDVCSWCILLALVPRGEQPPEPMFFLLPKENYSIFDDWETCALEATGSKTVLIEQELFIPEHRSINIKALQSSAHPPFTAFVPGLLAPIFGSALRAYEIWREQLQHSQTKTREQVASFSHVQIELASIAGDLRKAQALLTQALALSSSVSDPKLQRVHSQRDYADVVHLCLKAVEGMFKQSGANVIRLNHPLQQRWRDIEGMSLHVNFNTFTAFENFGRSELGLPLKPGLLF